MDPPQTGNLDVSLKMRTWNGNSPKTEKNCRSFFVKVGQLPFVLKHKMDNSISNKDHICNQESFCGYNLRNQIVIKMAEHFTSQCIPSTNNSRVVTCKRSLKIIFF